ncbi:MULTISPECIES: UDP-glucose 4-epimerase family protein [Idiomarina]|uniref:UDP-glucose 4-epimerase family protein n=1 Tax=Idiomarina TaxID=135575 RepID=UPI000C3806BD|nr:MULTISPECIES: SDR family oxidoreductase [Idiomarina]MBP59139.1 nucleoside-diphosphate sugar epimerase [Idiomarina sp.]
MKIILTGASGFIGSYVASLIERLPNAELTCPVRRQGSVSFGREIVVGELDSGTNWSSIVLGKEVIIHAAARAHIAKDDLPDPLSEYRKINVDGTLNLAREAASAGVRRFIFISSIGVNGNINQRPFTEEDRPNPSEFYAQSKWEAEQGLWEIGKETGMEIVIIRPPLVYGPGAPGNFGALTRWVEKGIPLPLGAIRNQRSLVAIDNLVDLIVTCVEHPNAANQVFLAGDGEDLSTTELLKGVAQAMGRPSRLIPVPEGALMFGATLLGKKGVAQRLLGSLQVDISKARQLLGWKPPVTVIEGLTKAVGSYRCE